MNSVTLRNRARTDLVQIIEYTKKEWGKKQADELVAAFEIAFSSLVDSPLMGRKVVRRNNRALIVSKLPFMILYQVQGKEIMIRQIIHTSRRC